MCAEHLHAAPSSNEREVPSRPPSRTRAPRVFLIGASPSLTHPEASPANDLVNDPVAENLRKTGGNTGNQVIAYGLLKGIKFEGVSWDCTIGPERVNAEFDLILVAAANFLHSGFDLGGMASFLEATNLPCVMVGVGAQSNDYSTDIPLQPGTERFLRVIAERTALIGARGPFSADVLARMGIHNVQVTGCPSYYMTCKPQLQIRKPPLGAHARLLINSSRDVVWNAFDSDLMIANVCGLLSTAIARNANFLAQSELPEIRIAKTKDPVEFENNVKKILKEFPFYRQVASYEDLLRWFGKHIRVFWDVGAWYREMKRYDFVFGNRFHGNIIALQAGTPACVICHDTRTTEMCQFLGLPYIGLKDIREIDVDFLYDLVDPEAIQSRYLQLYPAYKRFLLLNGLQTTLE